MKYLAALLIALLLTTTAEAPKGSIAFNRNGKILLIDAATGVETELVAKNDYDRPLAWLPAGDRLIYWNHDGGAWDLWAVDPKTKETANLTKSASDNRSASGSPDGKSIAFMRGGDGLWIMDADGKNRTRLDRRGHRDAPPAWSPTGKRLALVDLASGPNDSSTLTTLVLDLDGRKATAVRDLGAGEAAFFLDDARLVLAAAHEGAQELVVVDLEKGTRNALTKSVASDRDAVLSPDRKSIAWIESTKKGSTLKIMAADGTGARELAPVHSLYAPPTFSPDGRHIAYESGPSRTTLQIYVVPTSGGPPSALTKDGGSFPTWRP